MTAFSLPAFDQHETVHFANDPATGLRAIIAIHSTALGPAVGGCRMWNYPDEQSAVTDALRLSRGMSLKNALADLPLGGGKSVIIGNPTTHKTSELLLAFGRVIDSLGGRYITAEDVGVTEADMATIAQETSYVTGLPKKDGSETAGGDPSPKTARGVFHGIKAAVHHELMRDDLEGIRVAVQGLGAVGYKLCNELHAAGAKLVVSDLNETALEEACDTFGATRSPSTKILYQDVDVIAPCAMGGILNADTIPGIQARIVAGGANNQLLTPGDGYALHHRGILYAPDYVINAGGIIAASAEYLGSMPESAVWERIAAIEARLLEIFGRSGANKTPPHEIADELAHQRLHAKKSQTKPVAA